ncbi:CHAT domain-containing protein [Catellatospora sp. NPDC049609]|uniref:CHAT domain-containing protein n=1 Tax=Catellatospora sp. NPDC049609 TaxID=3155505 RepID=UPI0034362179
MEQEEPQLVDVVGYTAAWVELLPEQERAPWRLTLSWLLECRYEMDGDPADLEAAIAEFARLPVDTPGRAKLAAVLLADLVDTLRPEHEPSVTLAMSLAEVVRADPAPLPGSLEACAVVRAMDLTVAGQHGRPGFSPQAALAELDELAAVVGDLEPHRFIVDSTRLAMNHVLSRTSGDHALADRLVADMARVRDGLPAGSSQAADFDFMTRLLDVYARTTRDDVPGAIRALDELIAMKDRLAADDPMRTQLDDVRTALAPLLGLMGDGDGTAGRPAGAEYGPDALAALRRLADAPGLGPFERALRLGTSALAKAGAAAVDPALLDEAVAELTAAVELSPEHDVRGPFYRFQLGHTRLLRYDASGQPSDLVAGIAELERARAAMGTSVHRHWTLASMQLARAYRAAGRDAQARDTALGGLRGHAWGVLLQADPSAAEAAARSAANDAIATARWCAADGLPEPAARALDMGRGLILHAATERRAIPERLAELGQPELVERWRQAVAEAGAEAAPVRLRHHVMSVLAGIPVDADGAVLDSPAAASARLLDPPDTHEIRAALRALGMDALVYLVPGGAGDGFAVVLPADEPAVTLALPGLTAVPAGFASGRTRDLAREPGREMVARGRLGLDDVCDWAWQAAIGPLLEHGLPAVGAGGGPPRVVLIPMRELTAVPWHAARRTVAGEHRYALEQAVFSYAPSARLLCDAAWAPDVPLDDTALVLGDPATTTAADLPAARAEALAVHEAFYGRGVYLGRTATGQPAPAGAGTRREVLDRLLDGTAGTVLHLACHGVTGQGDGGRAGAGESSYLALAGGDRLSAEELVGALAARAPGPVGLSVLAACNSSVSGRGLDEAFSLATALLAGGSRTVVGTLWSVPDAPTSALMFMFHHYLRREGGRPLDALHRAQLWMIAKDRKIPEGMPESLRTAVEGRRAAIDAWAGFVHTGR